MVFVISGLPMPPTSNNSYCTNRRTGQRFPSKDLKEFKQAMKDWCAENRKTVLDVRAIMVAPFLFEQAYLRVDRYFGFPPGRIFSKANLPKRMDVSNRIKAMDDALSEEILGLDDSWFFSGSEHKAISQEAGVILIISKIKVKSVTEIMEPFENRVIS